MRGRRCARRIDGRIGEPPCARRVVGPTRATRLSVRWRSGYLGSIKDHVSAHDVDRVKYMVELIG
jgi:hypothetical protein